MTLLLKLENLANVLHLRRIPVRGRYMLTLAVNGKSINLTPSAARKLNAALTEALWAREGYR